MRILILLLFMASNLSVLANEPLKLEKINSELKQMVEHFSYKIEAEATSSALAKPSTKRLVRSKSNKTKQEEFADLEQMYFKDSVSSKAAAPKLRERSLKK